MGFNSFGIKEEINPCREREYTVLRHRPYEIVVQEQIHTMMDSTSCGSAMSAGARSIPFRQVQNFFLIPANVAKQSLAVCQDHALLGDDGEVVGTSAEEVG